MTVAQRYAREGWGRRCPRPRRREVGEKVAADIGNQFAVPAFGHAIDVTSEYSVAHQRSKPLPQR